MGFRTKIDFSNNRQIKQFEQTLTNLSGATVFGLPFSELTKGPNPLTSGDTETFNNVGSTFSGNSSVINFNWYDPNMELGINDIIPITNINSGDTQNIGPIFVSDTTTIIDGNTVALTYFGIEYDITPISVFDLGGGNFSGTVETQELVFYSATSLDFSGRTIWVDVSGITRTNELIVTKNPIIGRVFTCIDNEGKGAWLPSTGSGTSVNWYAEPIIQPNILPQSNGINAISIGNESEANSNYQYTFGDKSGKNSNRSDYSLFLGYESGLNGTSDYGIFIGKESGKNFQGAGNNILIGHKSGLNSNIVSNSILVGKNNSVGMDNNSNIISIGVSGSTNMVNSSNSILIGTNVAKEMDSSPFAIVIGDNAGFKSDNSKDIISIGTESGVNSFNSNGAILIGAESGNEANDINNSIFIGTMSGKNAKFSEQSIFIGNSTGMNSQNNTNSIFIGNSSGLNLSGTSSNILIGFRSGLSEITHQLGNNNIIIGNNIRLPKDVNDSLNIGGVLFGTGLYSIVSGNPSDSGNTSGRIGIKVVEPTEVLDVDGNARFRTIGSGASSGALHYTSTGVLTTSTSDKRLKENIVKLDEALEKIRKINGYYFNWIDENNTRIGFIAQNVKDSVPELVFKNKDGYYGVHYDNTVALVLEGVKELDRKINKIEYKTPTSSKDTYGDENQMVCDDDFLYVKTKNGWRRTKLEEF